jgi:hypothetical protein
VSEETAATEKGASGGSSHVPGRPDRLQEVAIWLFIFACGIGLLYFRYDWGVSGGFYAKRGFVLSLYLFVIMLPTAHYLARRTLHSRAVTWVITAILLVVFAAPYRLLGLSSLAYYRHRPEAFELQRFPTPPDPAFSLVRLPAPRLQFLPSGSLDAFPDQWLFLVVLFAVGVAAIWTVWRIRERAGHPSPTLIPKLLTLAFAVICAQSFLHSGMRAPYTYLSYFQEPRVDQHWYLVYHFPHQLGASEGDQYTFSPLENYFQGVANSGYNGLIRRPFGFYVESQISYFVNDFYGWLGINCLAWLVAVFATGRLVGRLTDQRTGLIAAGLVLFGSGFLAFVGTPSMYMENYATAAIALCAFEDLIVTCPDRGPPRWALFTGVLALCALVYDLEPLFAVLLLYGLSRRVSWRPLLASLLIAGILLEGFTFVVTHGLHIPVQPANEQQLTDALHATFHLIVHPSLPRWYDTAVTVVPSFFRLWLQAFFVIPPILAIFGLRHLHDRSLKVLVWTLFGYGFVVICVLQIGNQQIGTIPRLIYPTFIGVYLPAAVALRRVADHGRAALVGAAGTHVLMVRRAQIALPWIVVAAMAVLVNIDLFGYPTLYVEYFVNSAPAFLPH